MASDSNPSLFVNEPSAAYGTTEVFGETFETAAERREHFRQQLDKALDEIEGALSGESFTSIDDVAETLWELEHWPTPSDEWARELAADMAESEGDLLQRWKDVVGFPEGDRERIMELSDPPFFTVCPNPFLDRFVEHHGTGYEEDDDYNREPFAYDVGEGTGDWLYQAHTYVTKVPHKAIMRYLLHYTDPGDVVLDGFAGSGMAGVAARMCEVADKETRAKINKERSERGLTKAEWGYRHPVLADLGPTATFIAANFNLPFDLDTFIETGQEILDTLDEEIGWMYETEHTDGRTGRINYTVWSQILGCPECGAEVNFHRVAMKDDGRLRDEFACPSCGAMLDKNSMDRLFETKLDPVTNEPRKQLKREPVLINYEVDGGEFEKEPDREDLELIERIEEMPLPDSVPIDRFPIEQMSHGSRIAPKGVEHVHQVYVPRAAQALGRLWELVEEVKESRLRNMLFFWIDQAIWGLSVMNRYQPTHYSQTNRQLTGVYYIGSLHAEVTPRYNLSSKIETRLESAFSDVSDVNEPVAISTGNAATLGLPDDSVDFVFTDPPFGENKYYADLNFLTEAWYGVVTNPGEEAIIDSAKSKNLRDYQEMMTDCFVEYHRVLKPGRWMTMVFHNSHNRVWHAIQEALQQAGFVVADIRTLDKKHESFKQVVSDAAKQDLIISCYKPSHSVEKSFSLEAGTENAAWDFIRNHLDQLPVFVGSDGQAETIAERQPHLLYDRMVAFHVQRGVTVPLSNAEFREGLDQRFAERDGMYFLPSQTAEYDRKRMEAQEMKQLTLVVKDEQTAIQWLRQALDEMPQTRQQLHPDFTQEVTGWDKHEEQLELKTLLEENFLQYDGTGDVPSQISEALQQKHIELRDLEADDDRLQEEAEGRWYVPDPAKSDDVEKMRRKELLNTFEEYHASDADMLKTFRSEAVRAGFQAAWQDGSYRAILEVARKIEDDVLEEDPKLLMFRDQAEMRIEDFEQTDGLPLFENEN